jgi:hypothetical protein
MLHDIYYIVSVLFVLILDFIAITSIFDTDKEPESKIGWTIGVLVFPLLGAIVWFLFGRNNKPGDYFSGSNDLL